MELYTRGLLKKEHTGGLELNFGNKEAALVVLHEIANGTGFGAIVGRGIRKMKEHFATHFGIDAKFMQVTILLLTLVTVKRILVWNQRV